MSLDGDTEGIGWRLGIGIYGVGRRHAIPEKNAMPF